MNRHARTTAILLAFMLASAAAAPAGAKESPAGDLAQNSWLQQLKNPATRIEAEWNLRTDKDPRKIPALVELLRGQDNSLKITTLQILSESGDSALWKTIVPLLKDKDPGVREAAAFALGALGERGAVPHLVDCIMDGMDLKTATVYWVLPSDITHNYRYAAVEALNRLSKQNFKYTRAVNNFGRIFWLKKINAWWKEQKIFYNPAFVAQVSAWRELKTKIETVTAAAPKAALENTPGGQEFDLRMKELKEYVEAIAQAMESSNPKPKEMREHSEEIAKAVLAIDEIFVYTPELAPSQAGWNELKERLVLTRKTLESYLKLK